MPWKNITGSTLALTLVFSAPGAADSVLIFGTPDTTQEASGSVTLSNPVNAARTSGTRTLSTSSSSTGSVQLATQVQRSEPVQTATGSGKVERTVTAVPVSKPAPKPEPARAATPTTSVSTQIGETLARGRSIIFYDILFDFDKATLRPEARQPIANIAGALRANPNLRIAIEGHTDWKGSDSYNLSLSQRRARAVVNALVSVHGIDRSRLKPVGKGESHPVATNTTNEGRARNRRVEIKSL